MFIENTRALPRLRLKPEPEKLARMDKIHTMNYLHRAFIGWLHTNVERGHVPAEREINDMAPIDLARNRNLFERFLDERDERNLWNELQREHGAIETLTYFNG